jgi:hypothetical protein
MICIQNSRKITAAKQPQQKTAKILIHRFMDLLGFFSIWSPLSEQAACPHYAKMEQGTKLPYSLFTIQIMQS